MSVPNDSAHSTPLPSEGQNSSLDLARLENIRVTTNKTHAACPACRERGSDKTGNHLVIFPDGRFTCVLVPGKTADAHAHRQRIFQLAGRFRSRRSHRGSSNVPCFPAQALPSNLDLHLSGVVLPPPPRRLVREDRELESLALSLAGADVAEIALAAEGNPDGTLHRLTLHAPPVIPIPTTITVRTLGEHAAALLLEQLTGKTLVVHGAQAALRLLVCWQPRCQPERLNSWCTWIAAKLLSNGRDLPCDLDAVLAKHLNIVVAQQGEYVENGQKNSEEAFLARAADDARHLLALKAALIASMAKVRLRGVFGLENRLLPVTHALNVNSWFLDLPTLHVERERARAAVAATGSGGSGPVQSEAAQIEGWLQRVDSDGRLRCTYDALGTVTGRYSAKDPNLQGVPRGRLRKIFRASEGHRLVVGDLSQIELRIAALASGDRAMLNVFRHGHDLHRLTAATVLRKDAGEVTREDRQLGKVVNFGLIYGQRVQGFVRYADAHGISISERKAEIFRRRFFKAYPGISNRHKQAWNLIRSGSMALGRTVLGRRRYLPHDASDWQQFQAHINYVIQGSSAELLKVALVELHPQLKVLHARLIGVVHDEVIVEVPDAAIEEVARLLERTFEEAFVRIFNRECEYRFGRNLGELFRDRPACEVQTHICETWAEKG